MRVASEQHVCCARKATIQEPLVAPAVLKRASLIEWLPLIILPLLTIAMRARLLPWVFMWLLAAAVFAGCKWQTYWEARSSLPAMSNWKRSLAYLLFWPGMDAEGFFLRGATNPLIPLTEWLAAITKTLTGFALIWSGARVVAAGHPLAGGWMGMLGLVLLLHFGTFHLIVLTWQRVGIGVKPIMQRPLASRSLSELWGKRWNLGFRKLSHTWVFQPLQKRFGVAAATLGAFLASGLLHDLVISVPARGGYGLPTAYFVLQGFGVLAERSEAGRRIGLGHGARGWLWTALIAAGPLYWLFHPWFVMRVIVPFLRAVAG
ncbi:MAG TPA: MBOAT family protein [Methylomirabilota bacterium]|nr:MBOAT family protein [Methylomirabilota bacterium]